MSNPGPGKGGGGRPTKEKPQTEGAVWSKVSLQCRLGVQEGGWVQVAIVREGAEGGE